MKRSLAALLALVLSGCATVATSPDGRTRNASTIAHTLRFGWDEDVAGLNPHVVNNVIVSYLSGLTMAWLLRGGADNRPGPELAVAAPTRQNGGISKDGKTIVYRLRRDAKWSDGAPFTSQDVVFSTNTVLNPANNEQSRYGFDVISSVRARGPYEVEIRLKRPYAAFIMQYFNSDGVMCLLPEHILGRLPTINKADYNALPVGIGPFKYVRWDRGQQVEMAANPLYFRGKPKLERVIYRIVPDRSVVTTQIRTHELDLYPLMGPKNFLSLKGASGVQTFQQPGFTASFITLNHARGVFEDIAVRRAFRAALNRPTYLHTIYSDLASLDESFYPPAHPLHAQLPVVPHDGAQAIRTLEGDGWTLDADGVRSKSGRRLEINVVAVSGSAANDQLLELMRADLKPAGFSLTIRHFPASMIFGPGGKLPKGDFDATLESQTQDILGDQSVGFACDQKPPTGYNFGRTCIPEVDRLFAQFNASYDEATRRRLALEFQRRLIDDVAFISLPKVFDLYGFNSDLKNYKPSQVSPFDNMMDVDI